MILMIPPFCSLAYNESVVKSTSWTIGKSNHGGNDLTFYLGLRQVAIRCDGPTCDLIPSGFTWGDADCPSGYCEDCKNSATDTTTSAALGVITLIPQLMTDLQRGKAEGDFNCQKWVGVFTGLLSFATTLFTLQSFYSGCSAKLPDCVQIGEICYNLDYYLGPSFYCMLFATLLKLFDIWANLIVPVSIIGYKWKNEDNTANEESLESGDDKSTTKDLKVSLIAANPMRDESDSLY